MNDLTLVRFSGHEGIADVATLEGSFGSIKPQLALAVVLVGSVTGETVVRENRPDIPIEIDLSKKPTGGLRNILSSLAPCQRDAMED